MGLFGNLRKPKWKHEDWRKRRDAVKKINDQKILIELARNDPHDEVRRAAIGKIKSESVLVDIAKNDNDWLIRKYATDRITNQGVLIDIAKNDEDGGVRSAAIKKIKDENLVEKLLRSDSSREVQQYASAQRHINYTNSLNKTSQSELVSIAKDTSKTDSVRKDAIKRISNKTVLLELANTPNTRMRRSVNYDRDRIDDDEPKFVEYTSPIADAANKRLKELGYK